VGSVGLPTPLAKVARSALQGAASRDHCGDGAPDECEQA